MPTLSHCPFCGGRARVFESHHFCFRESEVTTADQKATRYRITCIECRAFGPSKGTQDDAAQHWNERNLFGLPRKSIPDEGA